ncbi:glycoside hydrolase family 10 protein [Anaerocolumna xylanovorans]|uniref:Uncharacterized lipoprotein YddW, UPF0748 family n=1 Tax=Anaerocolumna xylanovorans DSM 12503 TaxID=1121345 RepID=A0A1M7Y1Y8_9FIRM|nr:family 10 glycosylhydrolase [Anaerocolumna xylanovorans]SHO45623.1 Uncharacterized lipoprotein YddW, UPF0748 family [Anaerocolumna xylanovorans DSM 12503]
MLHKIKRNYVWLLLILLLAGSVLLEKPETVFAAKDTAAPKISVSANTTAPTNTNVKVTVKATDASGIKTVKWAYDKKAASYFKSAGKALKIDSKGSASVSFSANRTYTFYALDKAGNAAVKTITISNIDKKAPSFTVSTSTQSVTNQNVVLTFSIKETGFGIDSLTYLTGSKKIADFSEKAKSIPLKAVSADKKKGIYTYTAKKTITANNTFTFLLKDKAGNTVLKTVAIKNIDKTAPVFSYTLSTADPTNKGVTVQVKGEDLESGLASAFYMSGVHTANDFTEGARTEISLSTDGTGNFPVTANGSQTVMLLDKAGNSTIGIVTVSNIDVKNPTLSLAYSVMNQKATITFTAKDASNMGKVKYLKGSNTSITSDKWDSAKEVTTLPSFTVTDNGTYSVMAEDKAGNRIIKTIDVTLELKAVWISYLEFASYGKNGFTEDSFEKTVNTMFDNIVKLKMNAVVVQVRPFGDAMYPSAYFPWSKYISGTQGVNPGFDPLAYMVKAAHERGLAFHAWLNPYRVTTASTDYSKLSKDNPARVWKEDKDPSNDRNVLSFDGSLYYNPAVKGVQELILNGIKEIVTNYDVDGIHFDDYFYPALGSSYKTNFDAQEYQAYAEVCKKNNVTPMTIANWRRYNVNTLVRNAYSTVKKIKSKAEFGISPGGYIDSLASDQAYYVDVKTWLSSDGYVDYICPQLYWTFSNSTYPYDKILKKWLSYRTSSTVKVYVGLATYRAGSNLESDWKNDPDVLRNQLEYGRNTGLVDGFVFFRYEFFYNKTTKPGVDRLLEIL